MSDVKKRGYTYAEAAIYLGSSETVIKRAVARGDIPARYLGSRVLLDVEDLDAFFDGLPTERTT